MANPDLGKLLRLYRKSCNLSAIDVAKRLNSDFNISITDKAVYSWETSATQPPADTLLALCRIYEIPNILESLGYMHSNNDIPLLLTAEEKEIINRYRTHRYFNAVIKKLLEIEE